MSGLATHFSIIKLQTARAIQGKAFAYRVIEQVEGRISEGTTYIVQET